MSVSVWGARSCALYSSNTFTRAGARGRPHPSACWQHLLIQPKVQLATFVARACCWLTFLFIVHRAPVLFFARLENQSSWSAPSLYGCVGLFSRVQEFALVHVEFHEVPTSLAGFLWIETHLPLYGRGYLSAHPIPLPGLLIKMLNGVSPTVCPRGEPLVTSCQMDFIPPVITLQAQPFSQFSACFTVHCLIRL